jgi:XTP/dITP diphosphohydrolase
MREINNLLLATMNQDKVIEITRLVSGLGIHVMDLSVYPDFPEVIENGETLEENALLKAVEAYRYTGLTSMADDTGLFVDALQGEPGVFSSRFAGENASYEDNCRLLLERMDAVPDDERAARFTCVVALVFPWGEEKLFRGDVEGVILRDSRGAQGFGYDPVFYHIPSGKTFAEMSLEEKNALSHRAIAVKRAVDYLSDLVKHK